MAWVFYHSLAANTRRQAQKINEDFIGMRESIMITQESFLSYTEADVTVQNDDASSRWCRQANWSLATSVTSKLGFFPGVVVCGRGVSFRSEVALSFSCRPWDCCRENQGDEW